MRRYGFLMLMIILSLGLLPIHVQAADQIRYISEPDEIGIFLNNVAYARDVLTLPGGVDVEVVLPAQSIVDTFILREDGRRVADYSIRNTGSETIVTWLSGGGDVRNVTLEYLMGGIGWQPAYDMFIDNTVETVGFDFFAQITNRSIPLEDVTATLIAGEVDTAAQLNLVDTVTTNQAIAGYANDGFAVQTGGTRIQHVYDIGSLTLIPNEITFKQVVTTDLPTRIVYLWFAPDGSNKIDIIYKIRNATDMPFVEGITQSYEDGLFLGGDLIEFTPPGGEGSVTVGNLQTVRVNKGMSRTVNSRRGEDFDITVELTLENFGDETVTIETVDNYPQNAASFEFSDTPEFEPNNLLRWRVTLEAGEKRTITYNYTQVNRDN